ncbi:MAG: HypC/HybG/HupF family hydrogenase formation chaperone [Phycisphaerales bacterium]|nr:HypC/HybG/HupF family hydrogenase formation chaperone [Phycisphaerales bacterium]
MCLAIPGRIESADPVARLAVADVLGVRRVVSIDLLVDDPPVAGDWVLIHVGFVLNKMSEEDAAEQLRVLEILGESDDPASGDDGLGSGVPREGAP